VGLLTISKGPGRKRGSTYSMGQKRREQQPPKEKLTGKKEGEKKSGGRKKKIMNAPDRTEGGGRQKYS